MQQSETSFYRASANAAQPAQQDTETTMNASQNTKSGSTIEQQIQSIQLSQHQRNAVLHAARVAEAIVDAMVWLCSKLERPVANVFAKPNLKY